VRVEMSVQALAYGMAPGWPGRSPAMTNVWGKGERGKGKGERGKMNVESSPGHDEHFGELR
jgi:hypothetical protein